jgi:hypothetical protein
MLQKKHEISPQLYIFVGVKFLELKVFSNAELEQTCKNGNGAVPNTPYILTARCVLTARAHEYSNIISYAG